LAMKLGDPFTATVRRASQTLSVKGAMGSEPVEPLLANRNSVGVFPFGWVTDPVVQITVLDVHTGALLLRYSKTKESNAAPPGLVQLTPDDILVTIENSEIIGLPARGNLDPGNAHPLWRIPLPTGVMDANAHVHFLSDDLLLMPAPMAHHAAIVDAATGHVCAVLPIEPWSNATVAGHLLMSLGEDGAITAWDIAAGTQIWQSGKEYKGLLPAYGDSVFAFGRDDHLAMLDLANGRLRRRISEEWTSVYDAAVNQDRLGFSIEVPNHDRFLISISGSSGRERWRHQMSCRSFDMRDLVMTPDSFGCTFHNSLGEEVLILMSNDGTIRQNCLLKYRESVIPTPGRAIASGPQGMRVLPNGPAETPSR
jgi:hypothetical protein